MAHVLMLKTTLGAPDGIHVVEFVGGREYDMPDGLAETFCGLGLAQPITKPAPPPAEKALVGAPANKALGGPEERAAESVAEEEPAPLSPPDEPTSFRRRAGRSAR